MYVLGHDDISIDVELMALPHPLQRGLKGLPGGMGNEQLPATITAEGDEMRLSGLMEAFESPGHAKSLTGSHCPTQAKKRLEWATRHQGVLGGLSPRRGLRIGELFARRVESLKTGFGGTLLSCHRT